MADWYRRCAGPMLAVVVVLAMVATACRAPAGVHTAGNPVSAANYGTVGPGQTLRPASACASDRNARPIAEQWRPQNNAANGTIVAAGRVEVTGVQTDFNQRYAGRIDGNFTGTTEEIIRWGACKWGFDEQLVRAMAANESWWLQSTRGDLTSDAATCARIGLSAPCHQSYGLLQVKGTVHTGTYPHAARSTAFAVDVGLAIMRACYEGAYTWLGGTYGAGDLWGCVGQYFSGAWYDGGSQRYIGEIQTLLAERPWTTADFNL